MRRTLLLTLALAACSSDNNGLLDSGDPSPDVFDEPSKDAPEDLVDVTVEAARDVGATDVSTDLRVDAPVDVARDLTVDALSDAPIDVPRDLTVDAARDVTVDAPIEAAVDAPLDLPRDATVDSAVDVIPDVPIDAPREASVDAPVDAPRDVPIDIVDVPVDTGCAPPLVRCGTTCVDTRSDLAHCGACSNLCPGTDVECRRRTCIGGVCGLVNTASGFRVAAQTTRDCRLHVCDGMGGITALPEDADLPVDGNACTDDRCASGVASNPPTPEGRGCGTGSMLCDGRGACVDCVRGSDCPSGVCASGRCAAAGCSDGVRNGTETGVDCGGSCPLCPALVVLAGGSANVLAGSFDPTSRVWNTTTLAGRTVDGVSVAVTSTGDAVGMMRFTLLGDTMDNRLRYTVWRAGSWTPFADLGPTVTTQGAPAIVAAPAGGVWALFHGFDFNHYFAAYTGTAWSPVAETTGASGARAGAIARDNTNPMMVFSRGLPNELYARVRTTTWGGDALLDGAASFDNGVSPTAINLTATTALAVWNAPGGQLRSSSRSGGAWSTAINVPSALASTRVALARLTDTTAALAFRGTDGNLYVSLYTSPAWTAPSRVATGIVGSPAIARGIGGATAEMVFLDGTGRVMHARYVTAAWGAASVVGGSGLASVALASGP